MINEPHHVDYRYPDEQAEVIVVGELGWLRFRSRKTGELNERADLGEEDPRPLEDVQDWAKYWNKHGVAKWPDAWILALPTKPITAAEMYRDAKGYGPTLDIKIQVGPDTWRVYSPSKDRLLEELSKLAPEDAAIIPLDGGYRYQCFGSTLSVFAPIDGGLFKQVEVAEYASVALFGETLDPA